MQDEGSQLIALLADARPGMRVADYCAGAAGKTLAMAATMGNRGKITACDTSAARLEGAAQAAEARRGGQCRAPPAGARRSLGQAARGQLRPRAGRRALHRHRHLAAQPRCAAADAARDLAELVAVQHDILVKAAELVRPGGRLIYATCSLLPEENEGQMERFLALGGARFVPVPLDAVCGRRCVPGVAQPCAGPWLTLSPAGQGTDGFFCAVLERAA